MNVTLGLLFVNVVLFIALGIMDSFTQRALLTSFAFSTDNLIGGRPWTLITSMFLHGSIAHLGLNMIALFTFGGILEKEISTRKYMAIYFLGGIGGNVISIFTFSPEQLSIGASGAIFSLMGAAMLIKPFDFIAFPWIIPIPIMFVGIVMIVSNVLLFISPPDGSNISFIAHIGGFLVGAAFGLHTKGFIRGMLIIIAAFIIFVFLSGFLSILNFFDYTQAIQTLTG